MFGDYSIGTASRHPSSIPYREDQDLTSSTSGYLEQDLPRNFARAFPRNLSISQLAQYFSEQRLHADGVSDARSEPEPIAQVDTVRKLDSYVGSASSGGRRAQRQQGVKMLCDPSHLKSIQEMVERMVESEDQCSVSPPRLVPMGGPDPRDDEGYSSLEEKTNVRRHGSASSSSSASSCGLDGQYKRSTNTRTGVSKSKSARICKSRKSPSPRAV